jgi:peroxiredoxin (alkyl hydroperoxide reductase subunit C)
MIQLNEKVADFEATAYHKGEFRQVRLSDYRGKWVVVVFYPADFTFVCPTELGDLADHYADFQKEGAEVLSVSTDTHFTHLAWHESSPTIKKITYPMVADPSAALSKEFGVYIASGGDAGLSYRGTFIIDPEGVLKTIEVNDNGIGRAAKETLRKLRAAKFVKEHGEVCPANWEPGKETLKPGIALVGKI